MRRVTICVDFVLEIPDGVDAQDLYVEFPAGYESIAVNANGEAVKAEIVSHETTMVDEGEVEVCVASCVDAADLVKLARQLGVTPEHLDEAVRDCDGYSEINNGGLVSQILFLLEHNTKETVEKIIRSVDEDGNYSA